MRSLLICFLFLCSCSNGQKEAVVKKDIPLASFSAQNQLDKNWNAMGWIEKEGFVPIKKSIMKQMSPDEFQQFSTKKFAQYYDLNGGEKVQHYRYRTKSGLIQETGKGISVRHIDSQDSETISNAQKNYAEAKNEIGKVLEEISVNSNKYQDFKVTK